VQRLSNRQREPTESLALALQHRVTANLARARRQTEVIEISKVFAT
jgi:hypothetical protein